jgi:hypothetical protein
MKEILVIETTIYHYRPAASSGKREAQAVVRNSVLSAAMSLRRVTRRWGQAAWRQFRCCAIGAAVLRKSGRRMICLAAGARSRNRTGKR